MSNGPKISIITACYNAEETIEQTIQSVLNQTYENIEYIIVDGASTDGTMDIVNKYRNQIDIVISEPDDGIYDAFNKGARSATGEYIQYVNADDYLYEVDVISEIAEFIFKKNNPVIVYGGIVSINEDTGHLSILNRYITFNEITRAIMIPHPATFVRRDKILEIGMFNLSYKIVADYDLICRLYLKYPNEIFHVPLIVSNFRLGGLSSDLRSNSIIKSELEEISGKYFRLGSVAYQIFSNEVYYKKWLEKIIFENKSIAENFLAEGVKKLVIWGSGEISNTINREFQKAGIETLVFLDNDIYKQSLKMNNIQIVSPDWLISNYNEIDAIVFGFEGNYEAEVLKQIDSYEISKQVKITSWKELVSNL